MKETYSALVNPSDHRILFHLFALESRVSMFLRTHFGKYWSGKRWPWGIASNRDQQTFPVKSQTVNILGCAGHIQSLSHVLLFFFPPQRFKNVKTMDRSLLTSDLVHSSRSLTVPGDKEEAATQDESPKGLRGTRVAPRRQQDMYLENLQPPP